MAFTSRTSLQSFLSKPAVRWSAFAGIALAVPVAIWALNPSYHPGGGFDMEYW